MRDFNGAGKQAKRRRWRMKQACFEEGSQSADMQYPLIGLSRRCIPSWAISAPKAAFAAAICPAYSSRRLRSISLPFSIYNLGTRLLTAQVNS